MTTHPQEFGHGGRFWKIQSDMSSRESLVYCSLNAKQDTYLIIHLYRAQWPKAISEDNSQLVYQASNAAKIVAARRELRKNSLAKVTKSTGLDCFDYFELVGKTVDEVLAIKWGCNPTSTLLRTWENGKNLSNLDNAEREELLAKARLEKQADAQSL